MLQGLQPGIAARGAGQAGWLGSLAATASLRGILAGFPGVDQPAASIMRMNSGCQRQLSSRIIA